ncbi:MAG: hypothetical protein K6F74_09265 [Prevotella sp.]|nr:hypothetical protein [Prevotella sp.]
MRRSMRSCLLFISLLLSVLTSRLYAQTTFPADGESIRYTAYIEMEKGYVSGICILHRDGDTVHGSLFNEFGITALDFTYRLERKKVKLHTVMPMMNKWYIRKVLKKDLRQLMTGLQNGETTWKDERYHIEYQLTPLL